MQAKYTVIMRKFYLTVTANDAVEGVRLCTAYIQQWGDNTGLGKQQAVVKGTATLLK